MKKRNVLLAVLLAFSMFMTACGASDPFAGKWRGTCDLTDYIEDMMVAEDPSYADYMNFEDLSFVIEFTFEDGEISMEVDQDSVDQFVKNVEDGMYDMMDALMEAELLKLVPDAETLDDAAAQLGYENGEVLLESLAQMSGYDTYDAFISATVESADMAGSLEPLYEELNLSGTYEYDEEDGILTVTYEDESEEEMEYEFDGDELVIRISDGEATFDVKCEKEK